MFQLIKELKDILQGVDGSLVRRMVRYFYVRVVKNSMSEYFLQINF